MEEMLLFFHTNVDRNVFINFIINVIIIKLLFLLLSSSGLVPSLVVSRSRDFVFPNFED